jgi:L-asparaginase II
MPMYPYHPLFELTRGELVESIHFGAVAVVDVHGNLIARFGDPEAVTYLRSTSKPLQALAFIEAGGPAAFNLSAAEVALMCASHSGTDQHVTTIVSMQNKTGVQEAELLCGVHPVPDEPTAEALRKRGEEPTPNRHNCSGKHTGMLAYARLKGWPVEDYINPAHPVQEHILPTFAEMCALSPQQVALGVDGCSAPNFAVPLRNAALAFARLGDPCSLSERLAAACRTVTAAMVSYPIIVAGPRRFDTRLIEVAGGRIITKGGAEGYQGIGLLPGALGPGSPALGIALKISDGDPRSRARLAVTLEVLRQLGALSAASLQELAEFGPTLPVKNWRGIVVGEARPCFTLSRDN